MRIGKKELVLILGALLILSSVIVLIEPRDVPEQEVRADQIKVLFDFTKSEDAGNADWRIDGAYSDFADALRNAGFIVDSLGDGSGEITSSDLSGYKVFVIPEPQNQFSSSEINAILDFVNNGGGLVYIADHKSSDRDNDGWDSWSIWNSNLNFDSTFGIKFLSTQSGNNDNEVTDIEDVPILTENVTSFGTWLGTTMSVANGSQAAAYQTISGNRLPVLAYTTYGSGRVVVHCDSSTFDDGSADSDNSGDDLHDGWSQYDDATLGVNLVKWAANTTSNGGGETPKELSSHAGNDPYVAYGNGKYLLAYYNGKYVNGTFIDSSDGSQGAEFNIYRYGKGTRVVYNPEGDNFTVATYDYYLPNYHKVIMKFVNMDGSLSPLYTITNDANQSLDVDYGSGKLLFVWANLSREEVKGAFYDTQTGTLGSEFTIYSSSTQNFDVAVGYDSNLDKFLVVWTNNYDIMGKFVNPDGSLGSDVSFPSTANVKEAMLSAEGGDGVFMVTYRNGSFSSSTGTYFYLVHGDGSVEMHTINDNPAKYCGMADVKWTGDKFMVSYSDSRNGNQDVFVEFFDSSGSQVGDEITVKDSSDSEEKATGAYGNSTMLVAWYDYTGKYVDAKYYPPSTVPEMNPVSLILLLALLFISLRKRRSPRP